MNATKVLSLSALLLPLPLLLGSNAPKTRIAFAVADGASLTKTFEVKADMSLQEMSMSMGQMPEMEMTLGIVYKIGVSDEYVKVESGKPKKLKRTFDALSSDVETSMKMEIMGQSRNQDSNSSAVSDLEGKSVLFTWDAEKSEFKKAFDPAGGEEKLLEGLREDMDLRALLPEGEVEEGAEWELDPKELVDVIAPGGNLAFKAKEAGDDAMGMGPSGMENMADMFGDDVEGKCKATFTGMREVEGQSYAVVKLAIDIKAKTDMTETIRERMAEQQPPEGLDAMEFKSVDMEYALDAEGELLWDVGAGHFHALELSGTTSFKMDQSMSLKIQGRDMDIDQSMEFEGTTSFKAAAK